MDNNIIGKLENILFAAGDAMEISQIAQYFELDIEELTSAIDEEILKRENEHGLMIKKFVNKVSALVRDRSLVKTYMVY